MTTKSFWLPVPPAKQLVVVTSVATRNRSIDGGAEPEENALQHSISGGSRRCCAT